MADRVGLIERDDEFASIEAIRLSEPQAPCALMIVGEPGIGKTALLGDALESAAADGSVILRIGFSAAERDVAWSGLTTMLGQLPAAWIDDLPGPQRDALDVVMGERGPGTATNPPVAAALRKMLRRASADGPIVLAIDDLQWADRASASALSAAIRTIRDTPLVVMITTRPTARYAIDFPRILEDRVTIIELGALSRPGVHELLRRRGVVVSTGLLDDVFSLGSGNPLHTSLLADEIARHGWKRGALPPSITLIHQNTLDALPEQTSRVLEYAAVLDRIDLVVLATCAGNVDVEAALLEAERAGLISSDQFGNPAFAHPTVPAAIQARIGPIARRRIHRELAAAIASDDDLRAVHLAASASDPDSVIADALDRSASTALQSGAKETAGLRYLRAADLTPDAEPGERWRRTLAAADALLGSGNLDAADEPSIAAFETATDPFQIALAGRVRTQLLASRGDLVTTHRFVIDLLEQLEGWPIARAHLGRARIRLEQIFDLHAALDTAEALRSEMSAAHLDGFETEFEIAATSTRFIMGERVDAAELWQRARPIADATDYISAGWMALETLVWSGRDDDASLNALGQFELNAEAAGAIQSLAKVHDFTGNLFIRTGRWTEGEAEVRRAIDAAELSEITGAMSRSGLAWLLAATGRLDEARDEAARCSTASATDEMPLFRSVHLSCIGFVELCAGNWDEASTALTQAWSAADKLGMEDLSAMPFRADLVEALTLGGRPAEAHTRATQIVALAERSGSIVGWLQADRAVAVSEAAVGRLDAACEAAHRGLARHGGVDVPFERARLQLALGTALRRGGHRREAAAALGDALAVFKSLGAAPFVDRTLAQQQRLGSRHNGIVLTATEEQIARLVSTGRSNGEVAAEMVVSLRTVESNLTRVYRKLGVRTRSELAARFRNA